MSPKEKAKAIVLLSGGLDSTVSLAMAKDLYDVVLALTFNYGQRAFGKEIKASRLIAESYNIPHEIVALPWLASLLPKALQPQRTDIRNSVWNEDSPKKDTTFFEAEPVWVPNRNGVFLNIAAAYAESKNADVIVFGANAEEGEKFPDNTPEFQKRINATFEYSTLTKPRVETPVGKMDKTKIMAQAVKMDVPLHLMWSCYTDGANQCGECPSCYRFRNALNNVKEESPSKKKVVFLN